MGFWSSIKSKISSAYKSVDKAVGGYLPGGVSPSSSSSSSSSSKTTSSGTSGGGGGSSTTSSKSSGSSGGGGSSSSSGGSIFVQPTYDVTTQTYTDTSGQKYSMSAAEAKKSGATFTFGSGSSSSSSQNLVSTPKGVMTEQEANKLTSKGSTETLQPNTISAAEYSGAPPERYERPLGSAIGQSFKNVFNFGLIGQSGLRAYGSQIIEPFEYVGKPKAYKEVGYNINPNWRGTEFGFGLSENQKQMYTPEIYKDTSSQTWFDIGERKKRELFNKVGLSYSGEPARLIPVRLGEKIQSQISPKYEAQLANETETARVYYQGKIDTGELTVEQAQKDYSKAIKAYTGVINTQYQTEFKNIYSERFGRVSRGIAEVEAFQAKIFEPPAYPIIRGAGKAIETGAIVGATAFGGSGLTLAASAYLGIKTARQAVSYQANYEFMTGKQKIIGGAGLAAGVAASAFTFNLGVTKFYSEWRGVIYSDLSRSTATIRGVETLRTKELTSYDIAALKKSDVNRALTIQRTDVYQTGFDRAGFFSKGKTVTKIYDPQYEKFITSTETFTTSGYIPNVKQGSISLGSKGMAITSPPEWSTGLGRAKYISGETVRDFRFIAAAKDQGKFYNVASGSRPQRVFISDLAPGIKAYSTQIRGSLEGAGRITKIKDFGTSNLIITSGKKSSQQYFKDLYNVGASAAAQTARQAQKISISKIGGATRSSTGGVASLQSGRKLITAQKQEIRVRQAEPQILSSYQLPVLAQILPQKQQAKIITSSSQFLYNFQMNIQTPVLTQFIAQRPQLINQQASALRQGLITPTPFIPGQYTPFTPSGRGAFIPPLFYLNPGSLELSSNILRGGSRKTGYTPSFSALIFKIRGSYKPSQLARSGIDFRPITPGFKFKTGGGMLRKFLKF